MIQSVQKRSNWFKNDPVGSKMIQLVRRKIEFFSKKPKVKIDFLDFYKFEI